MNNELAEVKDAIDAAEFHAKRRQEQGVEELTELLDRAVLAVAVSAPFIVLIFERMVL